MSADNWDVCPRCYNKAVAAAEDAVETFKTLSETLPKDTYQVAMDAISKPINEDDFRTFREDYEFYGVADGKVIASYSGHCTECSCGTDFQYEHEFNI